MSKNTCNSEQLEKIYTDVSRNRIPVSKISEKVGKVTEDFSYVCKEVIEKSGQSESNCVISFLKRAYPGFFKQHFSIETSEISEADLCTDKERQALEEKKKQVCRMLIEELNSSL